MSKIEKFTILKGVTRKIAGSENDYNRKSLELTVRLPEQYTEQGFHEALARAELLIDGWLGVKAVAIPMFNSEELMQDQWKGKKLAEGKYAEGTTSWGWDFKDRFSENTLKVLMKGPVTIGECVFMLDRGLVTAKKVKQ